MQFGSLGLICVLLVACAKSVPAGENAPAPQIGDSQSPASQETAFDHSHRLWDGVLKQHVRGDLFDYAALAEDTSALDAYIAQMRTVTPEDLAAWSREQRFAFWINAYNAFTVKKVVKNLPLKSIRDLDKGFGLTTVFEQAWIKLQPLHPSGKPAKLSLNDIEHGILRARFKDARVHAAVNCASLSCPPLLGEAFVADRLEQQLDSQMRAFVADRKRNPFKRDKHEVRLSKIFDWFAEDFERDAGGVREYLLRYASDEDAAFIRDAKLKFTDYSWKLNAVPPAK